MQMIPSKHPEDELRVKLLAECLPDTHKALGSFPSAHFPKVNRKLDCHQQSRNVQVERQLNANDKSALFYKDEA